MTNKTKIILLTSFFIFITVLGVQGNSAQSVSAVGQSNNEPACQFYQLKSSVEQTRDEITVTVKEAEITPNELIVAFTISGQPKSDIASPENGGCDARPQIHLQNGQILNALSGSTDEENKSRFVFPPIPQGIEKAKLVFSCLPNTLPGESPENWELPLEFAPACSGLVTPSPGN